MHMWVLHKLLGADRVNGEFVIILMEDWLISDTAFVESANKSVKKVTVSLLKVKTISLAN